VRSVEAAVLDTPMQARVHVFGPFYGSDTRLGLAIAGDIVEAHGGRIWLADSVHGTRVRLSLPAPTERPRRRVDCHAPAKFLTIRFRRSRRP
jgi:K+-sensing histidine kinase KdpD